MADVGAEAAARARSGGLLLALFAIILPDPSQSMARPTALPPFLRTGFPVVPLPLYICFAVPLVLVALFVQASLFVGLTGRVNHDYDREWWGRAGAWILIVAAGWAGLSAIVLFVPLLIYRAPELATAVGGVSGLVSVLVGRSKASPANLKQKEQGGLVAAASNFSLVLLVPLFMLFLLGAISLGTTRILQGMHRAKNLEAARARDFDAQFRSRAVEKVEYHVGTRRFEVTNATEPAPLLTNATVHGHSHLTAIVETRAADVQLLLYLFAIGGLGSIFIGVNKFSMHSLYRNRLIRAYLGASRFRRDPSPFTGFDPHDNFEIHMLRPELLWTNSFADAAGLVAELRRHDRRGVLAMGRVELAVHRGLARFHAFAERWTSKAPHAAPPPQPPGMPRLANAIVDRLQRETILLVAKIREQEAVPVPALEALFGDLNRVIDSGLDLGAEYAKPAMLGPGRPSLAVQNRLVLEEAFSPHLVRMPPVKGMRRTDDGAALPGETAPDAARQVPVKPPIHVVNIALNLVAGDKLAWQQRKAESFTATPYHCGTLFTGYRDSRQYGGAEDALSLGTAVTISGAAASPNMGYHSSPALAFLLTLFNVRLGWWLGNPGPAGDGTFAKHDPVNALAPILREALGKTDDAYQWVYLSDGGHFENLGLYEMVLRRCHYIVVSDAGCDPHFSFEDLGNAIRKIRTDLGVPIEIDRMFMYPRSTEKEGKYCTIGLIRYTAVDGPGAFDGRIVYLKPGIYPGRFFPKDVYNYAQQSKEFPHETTADQWFSESQFESYRALGRHIIDEIAGNYREHPTGVARIPIVSRKKSVAEFVKTVDEQLLDPSSLESATRTLLGRWIPPPGGSA